ncbi:MAG: GNAT family N-acetyltransferase [Planctomycetes bacterium]|nr:GNAT family N-acetyltransferase [Planctomycetota bacterium]
MAVQKEKESGRRSGLDGYKHWGSGRRCEGRAMAPMTPSKVATVEELSFRPIVESDIALVEEWLQDAESKRRLGGMIPFRPCFEYQQSKPGYHKWIVYHADTPVALTGFEIQEDGSAAVVLLVSPRRRGRGYGSCVLKALASVPEAQKVTTFVGLVEADHEVAIRCLEAAGYTEEGPDPEDPGFTRYVLTRKDYPTRPSSRRQGRRG